MSRTIYASPDGWSVAIIDLRLTSGTRNDGAQFIGRDPHGCLSGTARTVAKVQALVPAASFAALIATDTPHQRPADQARRARPGHH
jgi:hypothetical protein